MSRKERHAESAPTSLVPMPALEAEPVAVEERVTVVAAPLAPLPKQYAVQIAPCPRVKLEAATPEAAVALYRQHYRLARRDLVVSVEECP